MMLHSWIKIKAETLMRDFKSNQPRKINDLLQQHFKNVQKIVKQIKEDGNIIQMMNQAQTIGREDEETKGYQSVIYHGATRSPERKTFVQTLPDGKMKTWNELVG